MLCEMCNENEVAKSGDWCPACEEWIKNEEDERRRSIHLSEELTATNMPDMWDGNGRHIKTGSKEYNFYINQIRGGAARKV